MMILDFGSHMHEHYLDYWNLFLDPRVRGSVTDREPLADRGSRITMAIRVWQTGVICEHYEILRIVHDRSANRTIRGHTRVYMIHEHR